LELSAVSWVLKYCLHTQSSVVAEAGALRPPALSFRVARLQGGLSCAVVVMFMKGPDVVVTVAVLIWQLTVPCRPAAVLAWTSEPVRMFSTNWVHALMLDGRIGPLAPKVKEFVYVMSTLREGLLDGRWTVVGALEGVAEGFIDGRRTVVGSAVLVGAPLGLLAGFPLGDSLGFPLGPPLGDRLGVLLGASLGDLLGDSLGFLLGASLGDLLGASLGELLGDSLGFRLGDSLGFLLGASLGELLGDSLGLLLGASLGESLGGSLTSACAVAVERSSASAAVISNVLEASMVKVVRYLISTC